MNIITHLTVTATDAMQVMYQHASDALINRQLMPQLQISHQ